MVVKVLEKAIQKHNSVVNYNHCGMITIKGNPVWKMLSKTSIVGKISFEIKHGEGSVIETNNDDEKVMQKSETLTIDVIEQYYEERRSSRYPNNKYKATLAKKEKEKQYAVKVL